MRVRKWCGLLVVLVFVASACANGGESAAPDVDGSSAEAEAEFVAPDYSGDLADEE
jgi:hypothetical protein